jgi:hypothetical protein
MAVLWMSRMLITIEVERLRQKNCRRLPQESDFMFGPFH